MNEEHENSENQKIKSKEVQSLFSTNVIAVLPHYYRIQQSMDRNKLSTAIQTNVAAGSSWLAKYSVKLGLITVNYF